MAKTVVFTAPYELEVREVEVPAPEPEEVQVEAALSAISPGTELLVYRGDVARDLPIDSSIEAFSETFDFPLQYGYAVVGEVTAVGDAVDGDWLGTRVFAFHPHMSRFNVELADIEPIPTDWPAGTAAVLANLEAATNFLLDGSPRIGEGVLVLGQGVVGLLTTALLAKLPLRTLVTVDRYAARRKLSERFGADASLDPGKVDVAANLRDRLGDRPGPPGADLTYELSGNPAALDTAISATGYAGRVLAGSWYGTKPAELTLDGRFHRSRIRIRSTQVSTLDPTLRGRWTRGRLRDTARRWLPTVDVDRLLTHRVPIDRVADAFELLDDRPQDAVQVLLTY